MDDESSVWFSRFGCRPNILKMDISYIPMPMTDIERYTKFEDYATQRIKTIETIGILEPVDANTAFLISTTGDPKRTLQLAIGNLRTDYAYPVNKDDICAGLRHGYHTVRVFGKLQSIDGAIVLVVDSILRVEDFVSCEKMLATMAKYARTNYSMYHYDLKKNQQLQGYIRRISVRRATRQPAKKIFGLIG